MRLSLAYVFPNLSPKIYEPCAKRFISHYCEFPSGTTDHSFHVIVNGGARLTQRQKDLFNPLVPEFFYHDNTGKDLGGFQNFANTVPCDFMVCLGAPVRPVCAGWLDMVVRALEEFGPGLFGFWGFDQPAVHIRTTAFAISTEILKMYPHQVDNSKRYDFEFGHNSITKFCLKNGLAVMQVTRRGAFTPDNFHFVEHADALLKDQHHDRHQ